MDKWYPPDFEQRQGFEVLMEFPDQIKSLERIGDQLFVTLMNGKVIEVTDITGEAKH